MEILERVFKLKQNNTSVKTEFFSGLTTFFTMSYLFILSPKLLEAAGMDFASSITVTALVVFICSCLMAFISNKPYAAAPFIGETAFASITVVGALGFPIKTVFTSLFITGIILLIMTLTNVRTYIINRIPELIKVSFCVGLGLFFILISLKDIGIVSLMTSDNAIENHNILHCVLGFLCFIIMVALTKKGKKTAILLSVIITTVLGIILGDVQIPEKIVSLPANMYSSLFQIDFTSIMHKEFISVFILIFILANIDTAGSLIGLAYKDGSINKESFNADLKKSMIADSVSTIIAPLMGTTTTGAYVDSMTGIALGGKTGLSAIITGILFLLGLIFTPLIVIIPAYAYAPALLYVGILLTSNFLKIDFNDVSEYAPAVLTISLMIFTNNIGFGIISGFFLYPIIKLLCKQKDKTNPVQWLMFIVAVIFFIIYPY